MRKTETLGPMVVVAPHRGLDLVVLWKRPTDRTLLLNAKGERLNWTPKQTLVKAHGLLRPSRQITNTKTVAAPRRRPDGSITMDTELQ